MIRSHFPRRWDTAYTSVWCTGVGRQCSMRLRTAAYSSGDTILERSFNLARMRRDATEDTMMADTYAALFAEHVPSRIPEGNNPDGIVHESFDFISTKFIDDSVLNITSMVNMNREQEYSQVVLIGDGTCTRFCRLPWPAGTVIYLVAPGEVHERAEAILRDTKAQAPRGCLLRRVSCDFTRRDSELSGALKEKGFRGDRVSVWGLQGIRALGLSREVLEHIFTKIVDAAAFESIIVGEFPDESVLGLENFLAKYGLVGNHIPLTVVCDQCLPGYSDSSTWLSAAKAHETKDTCPRLFRATQRGVSIDEMDIYNHHVAAAEEVDEDFFGNFS